MKRIKIIKEDIEIIHESEQIDFECFRQIKYKIEQRGIIDTKWNFISKNGYPCADRYKKRFCRLGYEFIETKKEPTDCDVLITPRQV